MEIMKNQARGVSLYTPNGDRQKLATYLTERSRDLGRSSADLVGLTGLSYSSIRGFMSGRESGQPIGMATIVAMTEFGLSVSLPQFVIDLNVEVDETIDLTAEVHHARKVVRHRLDDDTHMAKTMSRVIRRDGNGKPTPAGDPIVKGIVAKLYDDEPAPAPASNGTSPLTLEQIIDLLGRERVEAIVRRAFAEAVDRLGS